MDYYLNRDWTKEVRQQTPFPGMSLEWKLLLGLISGVLLVCTLISILKLGYSLTMAFIKFSFLCLIFIIEIILISSLLYPIKGVHWVLLRIIEFCGDRMIKFLEFRLSRSAIKRFIYTDVLDNSLGISPGPDHNNKDTGMSSTTHEIKQI